MLSVGTQANGKSGGAGAGALAGLSCRGELNATAAASIIKPPAATPASHEEDSLNPPCSHYPTMPVIGVSLPQTLEGRGLSSLEGRTVLVVEDDPAIGLDLRMALTRVGAVIVGPAGSVAAAFAALADQAVDAAILDIRLKNNELVFAVADALAALRIRFVFASGRSAALMPLKHSDRPFFDKPFQSAEVVEALSQLVNPSRA